jgi:hypothetical protein
VPRGTQGHFARALGLSPTGLSPCAVGLPSTIRLTPPHAHAKALQPRPGEPGRFGLFPFRSPLLGEWSLFLRVLRCFSSPRSPRAAYVFSHAVRRHFRRRGFPHSDIPGSQPAHGSPRLFAVYHVLLRRLTPRHPPYALSSLVLRKPRRSCVFALPVHYSVVKLRRAQTTNGLTGSPGR